LIVMGRECLYQGDERESIEERGVSDGRV
jgi:hypothetical protein